MFDTLLCLVTGISILCLVGVVFLLVALGIRYVPVVLVGAVLLAMSFMIGYDVWH